MGHKDMTQVQDVHNNSLRRRSVLSYGAWTAPVVLAATAAPAAAASPVKPDNPMAIAPWYDWWSRGRTTGTDDRELHWALFPTTRPYTLLQYTNQTPQAETARPASPNSTPQWGDQLQPARAYGAAFHGADHRDHGGHRLSRWQPSCHFQSAGEWLAQYQQQLGSELHGCDVSDLRL